ncbi:DUF4136 domain-containing protein [Leptobacterium flavescens]|uniref:DUF4136 domain-containing protein n=1 Tax=Leptobacterium flavescens TaxID=472055 RepID=A0A6P0UVV4_9FLAO|nr:DUF4136 domain-containing protein [Leptobacterium flavescens]NER14923.1 DUF4136 domain-containing protein [Leptobacterium flavescens]
MKTFKPLLLLLLVAAFVSSCVSVRVVSDYDKKATFGQYKSFAFFKPGIDKAEISDIDKKRILRAINNELVDKGFAKSDDPDLLISIFTKENQRVDVYNRFGYGYGFGFGYGFYNPYWGFGPGFYNNVSTRVEGSLYIDIIDARTKELIWQGKGTGFLTNTSIEKKEERINEFVTEILSQYPPGNTNGR